MSRSFFERSKKFLARLKKSCLERTLSGRLRPALGPAGKRRLPSRTGFPQSLIKIPRSISPARLIPASPRKTTSQLLPTRKAPAGRSILPIINEAVPNLGRLASVPSRHCALILAVGSLTINAHVYSGTENSLKKAVSLNQESVWAAPRTWGGRKSNRDGIGSRVKVVSASGL